MKQEPQKKMKNDVCKCKHCGKFYNPKNINFLLNLSLSKKIKEKKSSKATSLIQNNLINSGIDWCYCYTDEKRKLKPVAEQFLKEFELSYKNFKENNMEDFGFDFFSNKNYLYQKSGQLFSQVDFKEFLKISKNKLEYEEDYSFDFLNYEKMRENKFLSFYKSFFSYPNYLVIDEIELLNGKDTSTKDNLILRNLLGIVSERLSNDKKTFITLNGTLIDLKELLRNNFWDTEESIYNSFFQILESEEFEKKDINLSKKDGIIKISTKNKKVVKKRVIKKSNKKELEDPVFD